MRAFAAPKKGYKKAYFKTVCRTIESSVKPEQTATMCRAKIPTKILKSIVLYHCSGAYFDCDRVKKRTVKNKLVKLRNLLQYIKISLRQPMCCRLILNASMALKLITPSGKWHRLRC